MSNPTEVVASFGDLNLPAPLLAALNDVGYENPSPVQAQTIPPLLLGRDLIGHAPTGTGKTAAFALPILARMDLTANGVQALVLTPTRELAIQVAEAFTKYAAHISGLRVLPVYGGQEYGTQIRQLNRGVHVVVGTPGRVMDHMRKGTLKLSAVQALVLDEADEMLRMGFIEDVQWILEQTPSTRQTALFSATMPREVQRIAQRYLRDPEQIAIKGRTQTAETIRQRYWPVSGMHKLDALTRILEFESFDGMLIFVRTRISTTELAERLEARGYAASALNGDMPQKQREQTVERLKSSALDILVATDVAARGLDVDRISHVVNYDIPYDTESYVHRIGRTGRAGRTGDAILFVAPRERRMLGAIERTTRQKIERLELPTTEMVNNKRIAKFKQGISDTLAGGDLGFMQRVVEQYQQEHNVPALEIAAALVKQAIGDRPLLIKHKKDKASGKDKDKRAAADFGDKRPKPQSSRKPESQPDGRQRFSGPVPASPAQRRVKDKEKARSLSPDAPMPAATSEPTSTRPDADGTALGASPRLGALPSAKHDMERFRLEVGSSHGAKAGNIVGAIANEAGLESQFINRVEVFEDHSLVSLPTGMPATIFKGLRKAWVCGQRLNISRLEPSAPAAAEGTDKVRKKDKEKGQRSNKGKRRDKSHIKSQAGNSPPRKPKGSSKPRF